jgi:hypothetical protein
MLRTWIENGCHHSSRMSIRLILRSTYEGPFQCPKHFARMSSISNFESNHTETYSKCEKKDFVFYSRTLLHQKTPCLSIHLKRIERKLIMYKGKIHVCNAGNVPRHYSRSLTPFPFSTLNELILSRSSRPFMFQSNILPCSSIDGQWWLKLHHSLK